MASFQRAAKPGQIKRAKPLLFTKPHAWEYDPQSHTLIYTEAGEGLQPTLVKSYDRMLPSLWSFFYKGFKNFVDFISIEDPGDVPQPQSQKEIELKIREEVSRYYHWM